MASYYTKQADANRQKFMQQGDQLQTDLGIDAGRYQGVYGNAFNKSNEALEQLGATPGYTPEEIAQIQRNPEYQKLLQDPDYSSNYLNEWEQGAISGNPHAAMSYYDPSTLTGIASNADTATRGAVANTRGQLEGNASKTEAKLNDAIDPAALGLSDAYGKNVGAVLDKTASRVQGAIDPTKLGISSDYQKSMQFTPQDQQDIENAAGTSEGKRYGAEEDRLKQRAIEQGNTSPAALAAMEERLNAQEGSAAGDAMTDARIRAKQAAMEAGGQLEKTRLGAEQFQSGEGVQAGEYLGNLAAQQVGEQEKLRLGSQQDIATRKAQAAALAGSMGERAGEFSGSQELANENQIAGRDLGIESQNQATGQKLASDADKTASDRQAFLATNRQGVNQANQNAQFNRGYAVTGSQSQNAQNVANARRQGQQTYIQGEQGQQNQAQSGMQTSRGQQIQAYGTEGGLASDATKAGLQADSKPGLFDKVMGVATGAAAGAASNLANGGAAGLNGPELAMIGEHGPEAVVKLDPGANKVPMLGINADEDEGAEKDFDYTPYSGPGGSSKPGWQSTVGGALQGIGRYGSPNKGANNSPWNQIGYSAGKAVVDHFNSGNVVTKPTLAILGEDGPEAVVPFNRNENTKVSTKLLPGTGLKSRAVKPKGPVGPHGPARGLLPLKPLPAYR